MIKNDMKFFAKLNIKKKIQSIITRHKQWHAFYLTKKILLCVVNELSGIDR